MGTGFKDSRWVLGVTLMVLATVGCLELAMGRSMFGPDGRFGWWEPDIWSSASSQRFADPYSCSHLIHGMLFYWLLGRALPNIPIRHRFLMALLAEGAWEILENSPLIINRYRAATIALGYNGDSILNSLSDLIMMSLGFLFACRARLWLTIGTILALEIGCAIIVRDNLTLNIIMLICPMDAIKHWQMGASGG